METVKNSNNTENPNKRDILIPTNWCEESFSTVN